MKYHIGVDEAGRGPLAGPVAVGAVIVPKCFDISMLEGIKDSKQLTSIAREEWYARLRTLKSEGILDFSVSFSSARTIDRRGIVFAIQTAIARCFSTLDAKPDQCKILLDGNLHAPATFRWQETIIRGDESEPLISLASIAAKVARDALMRRLSPKYPAYDFHIHKGYGTSHHRAAITLAGYCPLHRVTFCKNLSR